MQTNKVESIAHSMEPWHIPQNTLLTLPLWQYSSSERNPSRIRRFQQPNGTCSQIELLCIFGGIAKVIFVGTSLFRYHTNITSEMLSEKQNNNNKREKKRRNRIKQTSIWAHCIFHWQFGENSKVWRKIRFGPFFTFYSLQQINLLHHRWCYIVVKWSVCHPLFLLPCR